MNLLRGVNFTFALSLATAPLVLPITASVGQTMDGPMVNFVVAVAAAVGLLAANVDVESRVIWTFSLAVFLLSVGGHLLAGTGANSGDASSLVVVGVWVASVVAAGAVVFRD